MPRWKVRLALEVYTLDVSAEDATQAALLASPQRDEILEYQESEILSMEPLPDEDTTAPPAPP